MAEISKISAVAIANVAKVDAVTKANIANINDLTIPSGFTGLLDTYSGAAAAYSVRRLYSGYTGACMRVRRDSDNTEQDIGFDSNGDLDTSALATFVGSGNNGYVRYWYDQSTSGGTGSGNDAGQATAGNQPQIYNGTAVITENGKPALQSADDRFTMTSVTVHSAFFVTRKTSNTTLVTILGTDGSNQIDIGGTTTFFNAKAVSAYDGTNMTATTTVADNTSQRLGSAHLGTTSSVRLDGTQEATGTTSTISVDGLLKRTDSVAGSPIYGFNGRVQEVIVFGSSQSSNATGIETDINGYFSIYP